ncbi:MAG: N-6 DNA methylase [Planctomycetaceae bacterium]|nr:N-6 DNA methylase [Planctomycetaceae bacterium]
MSSSLMPPHDHRRLRGVFYTPAPLAEWMFRRSLHYCQTFGTQHPTILDPACGAGAFLLAARKILSEQGTSNPLPLLHGVDLDESALTSLKTELSNLTGSSSSETIASNILHGDALTGAGWQPSSDNLDGLNWGTSFPNILAEGGFDLIIANPPYLREKDARPEFERIALTNWGRRHKEPRMDLWHYFLHRSLDLVRPDGIVCFIVNSYWTQATGARKLIARLAAETTLLEVVDFANLPLFENVQGRHMAFWLQAARSDRHCRIRRINDTSLSSSLLSLHSIDAPAQSDFTEWHLDQFDLYSAGRLTLEKIPPLPAGSSPLGDHYEVRQGIAENPPTITRRHVERYPDLWPIGTGVFVLTHAEVAQLSLSPAEQSLLRPYWETRELDRYSSPAQPTRSILYLTPKTAPDIDSLPQLKRHLARFREILELRREVLRGVIQWWHLHWPREERLFHGPRIISLQMGSRPRFVYCTDPAAVGFSCHILLPKPNATWSLPALTAILNSSRAEDWFATHAKHRGKKFDIGGNVLKDFPLPPFNSAINDELTRLTLERQSLKPATTPEEITPLEQQIDSLVSASFSQ